MYHAQLFEERDTFILQQQATVLSSRIFFEKDDVTASFDYKEREFIIRNQGLKYYLWEEEDFHLIYDFQKKIGDTLQIYVPLDQRFNSQSDFARFIVDSLSFLEVENNNILCQHVKPLDFGFVIGDGILCEYLGWLGGFYLLQHQLTCDDICYSHLRCFTSELGHLNVSDEMISCDTTFLISSANDDIRDNMLGFNVYPNPVSAGNDIYINFDQPVNQPVLISILDPLGKTVWKSKDVRIGMSIDIPKHIHSGLYFVQLHSGGAYTVMRLLIL